MPIAREKGVPFKGNAETASLRYPNQAKLLPQLGKEQHHALTSVAICTAFA